MSEVPNVGLFGGTVHIVLPHQTDCTMMGQLEQRIQKKRHIADCKARSDKEIRECAKNIFDILRGPFLILDSNLHVLAGNLAFYQAFRLSAEGTEGALVYELDQHQWNIPELRELLEQALPQYGSVSDFPLEHHFRRLGVRKMMVNAREVCISGREKSFIVLSIDDITELSAAREQLRNAHHELEKQSTDKKGELRRALEYLTKEMIERKRAEEEARESADYFKLLLQNLGEDIIIIGSDYHITDVANETLATSGMSRDEIIGMSCFEALHGRVEPCGRYGDFCPLQEVLKTGRLFTATHPHRCVGGSIRWVDVLVSPMSDNAGNITHMIEAVRDTDRSQHLEAKPTSSLRHPPGHPTPSCRGK